MNRLAHNLRGVTIGWLCLWLPAARAQVIALPASNSVAGPSLRLSDLLPRSAPENLRKAAEKIDLGRAPALGSSRVFDRAGIVEALSSHPGIRNQVAVPDEIIVTRRGYPLDRDEIHRMVTSLLRERGISDKFPASALQRPEEITTADPNPALELRAIRWDANSSKLQFRLACVKAGTCPDFFVYLEPDGALIAKFEKLNWAADRANTSRQVMENAENADGPMVIKKGSKVRLLMQGDGIEISVPVVCLENGRKGQIIRVREPGNPQVLRAEVVSGDLLRSRLES